MSEKYTFPSAEWLEKYIELLNANKAYEDAAKTWEGDFVFEITPDGNLKETQRFYLDLWHGKCRSGHMLAAGEEKDSAYVYSGKYTNWIKLIEGHIGPIKGLMTRHFNLKGNMAAVMKAVKAALELVKTAAEVPTEFI
ncbi:MAG: SCP2 sterol-binding domain-containing protein [Promethearchaeota archaeon]